MGHFALILQNKNPRIEKYGDFFDGAIKFLFAFDGEGDLL